MFILNNIPFLFLTFITTQIFYISFISIFSSIDFYQYFYLIQFFLFIASFLFLKKYKKLFEVGNVRFKNWFYLLIPYLILIFIRFPMYTKVHDDLTYYLVAGEYTKNLWTNPHFLPTYAIYFYNSIPLYYNILVTFIGLRLTLLITNLILGIWMVSLNLRFKKLLKTNFQKYLLDFFFISFPFWPHLMAIHGTFMTDFVSFAFTVEAFYQFINKEKNKTFAIISLIIACLIKQSSTIYILPIFCYLICLNYKKINWAYTSFFVFIIGTFFLMLFYETGNPILGGLFENPFNKDFKSPFFPTVGTNLNQFTGKNFIDKLFWPFIAQFKGFAEGFVSKPAKIYFTLFLAFPYFFIFLRFLIKRKLFDLIIFFSFIFWSFYKSYARYVIPLIAVSWIYIILKIEFNFKIKKIILNFLYILILILSLTSIKTDFGWRPYHYFPLLKQLYIDGWKLILKDRYIDIKKEFKNEFDNYDTIAIVRGEKAYFYAFMGSLYGKKLIEAHNLDIYKIFLQSNKISVHIKNNLKNLLNSKKVLLVVDTMSVPEKYVKDNYFYKKYYCQRIGNFKDIPQIQFSSFSSIIKYECKK